MPSLITDSPAAPTAHAPATLRPDARAGDRALALWLLACCGMIFVMVILGGVTRLTLSGLSITQWQPLMGVIPPLDHADWMREFAHYKATTQYQVVNEGMSLADFKSIFWWEYTHRLWGRLIGIAFLVPFLYFLARRRIARPLVPRLAILFALGALQGAVGWYMVMSGLEGRTSVSQYRLAAHLGLALLIYAYMLWLALDLLWPRADSLPHDAARGVARWGRALAAWIYLVALSGSFVAGLHAGLIYNTFPLMNGHLIPPGLYPLSPWFRSAFDDVMTVQFDHRMLAIATVLLVVAFRLALARLELSPRARLAANLMCGWVFVQVALGVSTLLLVVPVALAACHQAGALVLFSLAILAAHELPSARRRGGAET
ncbi:MAG TPA: COX15/CtaA family protein [Alphaproteobacteria bacterium]|nr:COX15/CtaA family protein [Alphaproteobacteria bacterium]